MKVINGLAFAPCGVRCHSRFANFLIVDFSFDEITTLHNQYCASVHVYINL